MVLAVLAALVAMILVINSSVETVVLEEEKKIKASLLSIAGDQVKRALLIEDISQLNSIAKLVVDNKQSRIKWIEVFIEGETQSLASYPQDFDMKGQCRISMLPININEMAIGSVKVCHDEAEVSQGLGNLAQTITLLVLLGFLMLFLLVLRIVSKHINRIYSISNAIKAYAEGEEDVQLKVQNKNELGNLEKFFNKMVNKVNQSKQELRQMALYNSATNLPNKLKLLEDLPARTESFHVNIFIIEDYDHVEQTFGEVYAKQVIQSFVECLKLHLSEGAIYHVSSNIFIVLDSRLTSEITEHMTGKLSVGFWGDNEVSLKVKGVSFDCRPDLRHDVSNTILRMVRHVKHNPKEFTDLDEKAFKKVLQGYQIAENLLKGITDGLQVYAQVIHPVNSKKWPHVELLIRYEDQEHGLLSPCFFLNQVIELGGIYELDRFMLSQAENLVNRYKNSDLLIFINLTPAMIFSRYFKKWINSRRSNEEIKNRVVFEVNESFFIEMEEESTLLFTEISEAGFKLALDDFGSGYSSYNWLSQVPISYLKVDRSLISVEGQKSDAVLASISNLAENLGIVTIDEGVETKTQYDRVVGHGFDQVQGFYLDKPGPVEDKIQLILDMDLE